jgi:hypothetical protein
LAGSAFILIIYSLLPENYRFSRAIILIGSFYTLGVYFLTRIIYSAAGIRRFKLGGNKAGARIGVVGSGDEYERVRAILEKTKIRAEFVGHISSNGNKDADGSVLGAFSQVNEVIEVHRLNEVIFCAKDIPSAQIIDKMITLVTTGIEFKIAPPESLSIIGSNSIDTAGDLYVIDVNNVGKPENKRNKRLFDFLSSLFILLFSWVFVWFQRRPGGFFGNIFRVLFGLCSWVGYGKQVRKDLPALKPSVLSPADLIGSGASEDKINRAFLSYSKDYKVENDARILLTHWRDLGK